MRPGKTAPLCKVQEGNPPIDVADCWVVLKELRATAQDTLALVWSENSTKCSPGQTLLCCSYVDFSDPHLSSSDDLPALDQQRCQEISPSSWPLDTTARGMGPPRAPWCTMQPSFPTPLQSQHSWVCGYIPLSLKIPGSLDLSPVLTQWQHPSWYVCGEPDLVTEICGVSADTSLPRLTSSRVRSTSLGSFTRIRFVTMRES
jgi:hypothetical protein